MVVDIWQWLIGVSGAGVVIVFLGRAAIRQILSRDLERFKADLQRGAALELERQKAALRRDSVEHEMAFRWLHAKRADAIEDIYQKFIAAASAVRTAASTAFLMDAFGGTAATFVQPMQAARITRTELMEALVGYRPLLPEELEQVLKQAQAEMEHHVFTLISYELELMKFEEKGESPKLPEPIREIEEHLKSLEARVVSALRTAFDQRA